MRVDRLLRILLSVFVLFVVLRAMGDMNPALDVVRSSIALTFGVVFTSAVFASFSWRSRESWLEFLVESFVGASFCVAVAIVDATSFARDSDEFFVRRGT